VLPGRHSPSFKHVGDYLFPSHLGAAKSNAMPDFYCFTSLRPDSWVASMHKFAICNLYSKSKTQICHL
jgi:hypothetical protein